MGDGIVLQHPKGDILRLTDVAPSGRFADQNIDKEAQAPRLGMEHLRKPQGKMGFSKCALHKRCNVSSKHGRGCLNRLGKLSLPSYRSDMPMSLDRRISLLPRPKVEGGSYPSYAARDATAAA